MEQNRGATRHAAEARVAKRQAAEQLGIDDQFVADLVERFYQQIRSDEQLGPIFAARVSDWTPHLDQMKRFWRSLLFSSGEYHGNPMARHLAIHELEGPHFSRWLGLFEKTLGEIATDPAREHVMSLANAVAESLGSGIARARDRAAKRGELLKDG